MEIIYGCECSGYDCRNCAPGNHHPCAFLIERNGKEMKVCSRCDIRKRGDKYIARLFDGNTSMQPFVDYDALGALVMLMLLDDEEWQKRKIEEVKN